MRNIKDVCEQFAQRGPWGHAIDTGHKDESGMAVIRRVSYSGLLRRLDENRLRLSPTPRADKGVAYTPPQTDARGKPMPRRIIRAAA